MKPIRDLTGQTFGWLTARRYERTNGVTYWFCDCACGREVKVSLTNLNSGATKSCGCKRVANNKERALDLTGMVFGRLTAIRIDKDRTIRGTAGKVIWECACDCGRTSYVQTNNLRSGQSTSCGASIHKSIPDGHPALYKARFDRYRRGALDRGLLFELAIDEFISIVNERCHYCGKSGDQTPLKTNSGIQPDGRDTLINGIDRKDSEIGYLRSNCVPCCWTCNRMKGRMGAEEFIAAAKEISAFS